MRTSPSTGALMPIYGFSKITTMMGSIEAWRSHDGIQVLSQRADMQLPGASHGVVGPTWLVSVTWNRQRPTDAHMARVVDAFAMPAFEEDNHYPGVSRSLFCPLDEAYRLECECKLTEVVVVEPDGYTWTNPTDAPCRGCDLTKLQALNHLPVTPCPIHG